MCYKNNNTMYNKNQPNRVLPIFAQYLSATTLEIAICLEWGMDGFTGNMNSHASKSIIKLQFIAHQMRKQMKKYMESMKAKHVYEYDDKKKSGS